MYFLIDVIAVVLLLASIYGGFRCGVVKMTGGAFVYFFRIAFVAAGTFAILLLFQAIGVVNALTDFFAGIFGQTDAIAIASLAERLASVPNIVATVVALIPSVIISYLVFVVAFHYLEKLVKKITITGTLGLADRIFGLAVAVALYFIVYAIILGVIRSFANYGGLTYLDEILTACPLTGLIYKHNAFVSAFDNMGFAAKIMGAIKG